jgi:hypothetical protein
MRRFLVLSIALPFYLSTQAAGQTCVGMPSFSSGRMQVTGGGQFTDGANSFDGTFGYGVPKSLYGKAAVGRTSYDGLDGSSFDFGVGGGYQVPLHTSRMAELCPIASLSLGSGPHDVLGSGVDMSSRTFTFGTSLGALVNRSSQVQILPNASFQFANTRAKLDNGTISSSNSESYGLLTVGTGFVFHSRFSLNPSISFPVGLDGGDTSFGLIGAMNFGR